MNLDFVLEPFLTGSPPLNEKKGKIRQIENYALNGSLVLKCHQLNNSKSWLVGYNNINHYWYSLDRISSSQLASDRHFHLTKHPYLNYYLLFSLVFLCLIYQQMAAADSFKFVRFKCTAIKLSPLVNVI
jgi:hypothetical protein